MDDRPRLPLHERAAATETVAARFRGKPFNWTGAATCLHLARAQMKAMGHRPPTIPPFRSAIGARKALAAAGFASVTDLLDSMLPRIPPASMWVGDLAAMPGGAGLDAIVLSAGGKVLGYHDDDLANGLRVILPVGPSAITAAWRL